MINHNNAIITTQNTDIEQQKNKQFAKNQFEMSNVSY